MMKLRTLFSTLALILLCFSIAHTQTNSERNRGYWTLGINGGWAYQSADVKSDFKGYGLGVTLAKNLYYHPNHLLNFDVRGRFLFANMYGLDKEKFTGIQNNKNLNGTKALDYSPLGYVYQNYNTKLGELALEGVIGFNKMRERTNWELSLYGGLGLDVYQTRIDQYDGINKTDYSNAYKNLEGNSDVRSELKNNILDQNYETISDENGDVSANFMPSVGFDINYWFTPRFALGIGHRMTFAKTDLLDGSQWRADNTLSSTNDIYHYTNIGMRWILSKSRESVLPEITFTQPRDNPYYSRHSKVDIRAKIKHVTDPNHISCTFNDRDIRYDYFGGNVSTWVRLNPGRNEFNIIATNRAGRASETMVIYFETEKPDRDIPVHEEVEEIEEIETVDAPYIKFRNPNKDYQKTNRSNFDLKIRVDNIANYRDIDLYVNDTRTSNFKFRNNYITKSIILRNGTNKIHVVAKNQGGSAEKVRHIVLEKSVVDNNPHHPNTQTGKRPTVIIIDPNKRHYETRKTSFIVKAKISEIQSKNDITFLVNGQRISRFEFNSRTGLFSGKIILRVGDNNVRIEAKNRIGRANDKVTITFKKLNAPLMKKPTVSITSASTPTSNPLSSNSCTSTVLAKIKNVKSKKNIIFKVNGKSISKFDFNSKNTQFKSTINLKSGKNTIVIEVTNQIGRASDKTTVTCQTQSGKKPTITVQKPKDNSTTKTKSAQLSATIKNIKSKNNIQLLINNKAVRDFNFTTKSNRLVANLSLQSGRNVIKIMASNPYGKATKTIHINYTKPYTPKFPKVSILSPNNGAKLKTNTSPFKAKIDNATSSQITLKVNGKNQRFTFKRNILNANIPLRSGKNTVVVSAKNKDGNDQDMITIHVIEKITILKPIITNVNPTDRSKNLGENINLTAIIKNITNAKDILVKVNGKTFVNAKYNNRTHKMSLPITLKNGKNNIEIIATNKGGTAKKSVTLNRKTVATQPSHGISKKPTIVINSISQPTSNPFKPNVFTSGLIATVTGVDIEENISIKVNGKRVPKLKFTPKNNSVVASIIIKKGKNIIEITAQNNSGTVSITHNFDY